MCGFVGEVACRGAIRSSLVTGGSQRIRHRGPDDEGYLFAKVPERRVVRAIGDASTQRGDVHVGTVDPSEFDVALAFRRLAIVDLSEAGAQPMRSADGSCWIVFNGEIYNHVELASELEALGHSFRGHSDTEVLLASYRQWGRDCVTHLNGMWAFCILDLDRPEEPIFLSRDRFGEKPLYFAHRGDSIVFASEAKALVEDDGVGFVPSNDAVAAFLSHGAMPSAQRGETFYANVSQLPPAHGASIGRGGLRTWRYWSLPAPELGAGQPTDAGRSAAVEELRDLLTDSVRIRLRADVPVGTCLSGGVDSSSIAVTMGKLLADDGRNTPTNQHTFTAAYDEPGRHDERPFVELVLAVLDASPVYTFPTADGLAADLDALVWHQDEPFRSTSIFAQWCVMRAVHETGVTVLLDGQGADELFGGYSPFDYRAADLLRSGRLGAVLTELSRTAGTPARAKQLARAAAFALGLDRIDGVGRVKRRVTSRTGAVLARPRAAEAAVGPWWPTHGASVLDDQLRRQALETSLPDLLRYEDRNAMAHGVESRTPFLDPRVAELAFGSGAPYRLHDEWTKHVLRSAMSDRVPAEVIWRRDKVGFETPVSAWRDVIRTLLAERLPDSPVSELVDHTYLAASASDSELWRVLNVAAWWR